jgi:pyrophosphatase PpaX
MKDYKFYLFDADGTLFDTAELIYQCFVHSCKKFGNKPIARKEVFSSIGLPLRNQLEKYLGPMENQRFIEIQTEHMKYQLEIYKKYLKAFPGVAQTLEVLKKKDKKLAVVTSRKIRTLTIYLRETGMYDYFHVLVTPDETRKHKPSPEPALKAISLLGAKKNKTLFVGDAIYDIECGSNAGVDTAFVNWSHNDRDALKIKPTFCIDSMKDLCE